MNDIDTNADTLTKFRFVNIDAWRETLGREYCGWSWNDTYLIADELFMDESIHSNNRRLLKWFRDEQYLSAKSKGRVAVERDEYCITITNRATDEPLYALIYSKELYLP